MINLNPIKRFLQNYILIISFLGLIFGFLIAVIGIGNAFLNKDFSVIGDGKRIGRYSILLAIIGSLLLIASLFYFIATILNRRKFQKLIDTHSKAKFIRNLDEIEKLAWKLSEKERKKVELMRRKFKI